MSETNKENKKWAVVLVGGKQKLVDEGDRISVNKVELKVDETLKVESLTDKLPVTLKVIAHKLGEKVTGLKFKNKVRYIKRYGHRQQLTEFEVLTIGDKKVAEVKVESKPEVKKAAKAAPVKKAPAKKPAVKKVKND